eukprot:jgi/Mesen1/9201/ME000591S08528
MAFASFSARQVLRGSTRRFRSQPVLLEPTWNHVLKNHSNSPSTIPLETARGFHSLPAFCGDTRHLLSTPACSVSALLPAGRGWTFRPVPIPSRHADENSNQKICRRQESTQSRRRLVKSYNAALARRKSMAERVAKKQGYAYDELPHTTSHVSATEVDSDLIQLEQPPHQAEPTQPLVGALEPKSEEEVVGYILESSNPIMRQLLRTRRHFTASIQDAAGTELCTVRRPFFFISSTIFVELGGQVVGEVHRRWHLWRRLYDVYIGKRQVGAVENPGLWWWTFTLEDEAGGTLAVVDRNWRGLGFEFFTDAGQYVVRFGDASRTGDALKAPSVDALEHRPPGESPPGLSPEKLQAMTAAAQQVAPLEVVRPLSIVERAATLALAVSLDNDYFSRHGGDGGFMPLPFFGATTEATSSDGQEDAGAGTGGGEPRGGADSTGQGAPSTSPYLVFPPGQEGGEGGPHAPGAGGAEAGASGAHDGSARGGEEEAEAAGGYDMWGDGGGLGDGESGTQDGVGGADEQVWDEDSDPWSGDGSKDSGGWGGVDWGSWGDGFGGGGDG